MGAQVFVGCGGSGILTLSQLNGLLAEDPYWRPRLSSDVYYVVLDTRTAEIEGFLQTIRRQIGTADAPHVVGIRLAQGRSILQPMVAEYFVRAFDGADKAKTAAKERLHAHWWTTAKGEPFVAEKVRPLQDGAGQCPPASYFLAWHDLPSIEGALVNLFTHEIPARRAGGAMPPLDDLRVTIVAGLAGGTGRGTWELVAFKIREILLDRFGIAPRPSVYLFDASTFHKLAADKPETALAMKVNSLTGLSQLSCWVSPTDARYQYALPRMDTPGDPATDVLKVHLAYDKASGAPADNSCIITATNGFTTLYSHEDYFAMVARGLYATASRDAINAGRINENEHFLSIGAVTFEVAAVTLRRFFEGMYRVKVLDALARAADDAASKAAMAYLQKTGLRLDVTRDRRAAYRAEPEGTLLQRTLHHLLEDADVGAGFASLAAAFEEDDPEMVDQAVSALVTPRPPAVAAAFDAAEASLKLDPVATLRADAAELLRATGSVQAVRRFLETVAATLERDVEALPDEKSMTDLGDADPAVYAKSAASRTVYEYLRAAQKFNDDEEEALDSKLRFAIERANYPALRKVVGERYGAIQAAVAGLLANAQSVLRRADGLRERFRDEVRAEMKGQSLDLSDTHERLFGDPDAPEAAVTDEHSRDRFFRRTLKPLLRAGEVAEVLPPVAGLGARLLDVVRKGVLDLTPAGSVATTSALQALSQQLDEALRAETHLPPRFVEEKFSLQKVLTAHREAWLSRLQAVRGDVDRVEKLARRFAAFYGARPTRSGEEWVVPAMPDLLVAMGRSLATVCRPYWTVKGVGGKPDVGQSHTVALYYPVGASAVGGEARVSQAIQQDLVAAGTRVDVRTVDGIPGGEGNPFVLLAYSSAGADSLDQIASLEYANSTPGLYELLNQCEDPDGASIFHHPKGIGYTSPIYVKDPKLVAARWKPWLRPTAKKEEQARDRLHDALVYALMAPPEPIASALGKLGWSLPLVRNAGRQTWVFARRTYRASKTGFVEDTQCPWSKDQTVAQSIDNVVAALRGDPDDDGRPNKHGAAWLDAIDAERQLFWADLAPRLGFGPGTDLRRVLLGHMDEHLDRLSHGADAEDKPVWAALLGRVRALEDA